MPARYPRSRSILPSLSRHPLPAVALLLLALFLPSPRLLASGDRPNVLLITVDTLRSDRLSSYGYRRPTTPAIDGLLRSGARFANARTVEPLTAPAMSSMLTSRYPQDHGTTRNALKVRPGLSSVSKILRRNGYLTTAFVSNWTLAKDISGLHEHFHLYEEVLTRKRWLGMFKEEADAIDVTDAVIEWLGDWSEDSDAPFFVWAHYTDPHEPYRFRSEFARRLKIESATERPSPSDRYDTEIAATDAAIGQLLEFVRKEADAGRETLIVFSADHGENFGEHGAWGHGRHLWEDAVRIPLGFTWASRIRPSVISKDARIIDIGPTILGLLKIGVPDAFAGFDWSPVLLGNKPAPSLPTLMQAHRGAVLPGRDAEMARERGLLEVAVIENSIKTYWFPRTKTLRAYNLRTDPDEAHDMSATAGEASGLLDGWTADLSMKLRKNQELPAALDQEAIDKLKALGYLQ